MHHDYSIANFKRAGVLVRTEENFVPILARMGAVKNCPFILP